MDHNKGEYVELATVDCTSADPNAVQITQVFKNNLGPAYMYCAPTGVPEPNYLDHSTKTLYCALPLHPAEFSPF
jgi:hypothetical protein